MSGSNWWIWGKITLKVHSPGNHKTYLNSSCFSEGLPILVPFDLGIWNTNNTCFNSSILLNHYKGFLWSLQESWIIGNFHANLLSGLTVLIPGNSFIETNISWQHSVDKQGGLSISGVAGIESASVLNQLIVEVVGHSWFWVTIDEPHEINIVVFNSVYNVFLTAQESGKKCLFIKVMKDVIQDLHWSLSVAIVRRPFDVKVLGEVM